MGLLSDIFDFLSSFEGSSYIENAKDWGDKLWNEYDNTKSASLSLYEIDNRLYKQMRIEFRDKNIGVFTESEDMGWRKNENKLTHGQRNQLKDNGYIVIKKYQR